MGPAPWRDRFAQHHQAVVLGGLAALLIVTIAAPGSVSSSAGLLLVAGALIGVPHGSSDFVVAHRLFAPCLRAWWLPVFLAGYLAITGAVLAGWWLAPATTLVGFLAVSAFHFGAGPWEARHPYASSIRYIARALTPVLPIFLFHPAAVSELLGLLGGEPGSVMLALLSHHAGALLTCYVALLAAHTAMAVRHDGLQFGEQVRETVELAFLAIAAWALPPFLAFAIYFCGLHAVRHMVDLGAAAHPANGRAALKLAAWIVVPSALVCLTVLAFTWDAIAGAMSETAVLAAALRIVAALTVPHVLMECWSDAMPVSSGDRIPRG